VLLLHKNVVSNVCTFSVEIFYRTIFHDPTFSAANISAALECCTDVWCYEMMHTEDGCTLVAWYRY